MNDMFKKFSFIIFWLIYYNIILLLLFREIFTHVLILTGLIIMYFYMLIDTYLRPMTSEKEGGYKALIILIGFFLSPFLLSLGYWENKNIIEKYLSFWNSIGISITGLVLIIFGAILGILSRYQLGEYGSGRIVIEKNHKLVKNGIYKYTRNPLYLSGFFVNIGLFFLINCLLTIFIYFAYSIPGIIDRISTEEKLLTETFGEEYNNYKESTKRLIPFIY